MPKLSALSSSSKVKLTILGYEYECPWLAYNHYGAGEVAIFLRGLRAYLSISLYQDTYDPTTNSYIGSAHDAFAILQVEPFMEPVIRGSLVPVLINDSLKTGRRSMFAPSVVEANQIREVTVYDTSDHGLLGAPKLTYSGAGTVITPLNAIMQDDDLLRGRVKNLRTISVNAGNGTKSRTVDSYYPRFCNHDRVYAKWEGTTSNGELVFKVEDYLTSQTVLVDGLVKTVESRAVAPYIVLLNGNCEVTSSSGSYVISKPTAIESYRKIDGVWYRTV